MIRWCLRPECEADQGRRTLAVGQSRVEGQTRLQLTKEKAGAVRQRRPRVTATWPSGALSALDIDVNTANGSLV